MPKSRWAVMLTVVAPAIALGLGLGDRSSAESQLTDPAPVFLSSRLDAAHATNVAVVAASGGAVEATGGDGTLYRLLIPPDALYFDETITLTPLVDASGVIVSQKIMAVDMRPAGLMFFKPLTLTVVPPQDAPSGTPVTLQMSAGEDASAPESASAGFPLPSRYDVAIFHFSGAGIVIGDAQSVEALTTPSPPPVRDPASVGPMPQAGDTEFFSKLRNHAREQITRLDEAMHTGSMSAERAHDHIADWRRVIDEISEANTAKALDLAKAGQIADMDALRQIMMDDMIDARQAQLLGDESGTTLQSRAIDTLVEFAKAYGKKCFEQPLNETAILGMERQLQLLGISNDADNSISVVGCLDRMFSATGTTEDIAGVTYNHCGPFPWGQWDWEDHLADTEMAGVFKGTIILGADGMGSWNETETLETDFHLDWSGEARWNADSDPARLTIVCKEASATMAGRGKVASDCQKPMELAVTIIRQRCPE